MPFFCHFRGFCQNCHFLTIFGQKSWFLQNFANFGILADSEIWPQDPIFEFQDLTMKFQIRTCHQNFGTLISRTSPQNSRFWPESPGTPGSGILKSGFLAILAFLTKFWSFWPKTWIFSVGGVYIYSLSGKFWQKTPILSKNPPTSYQMPPIRVEYL